jgi:hypothetical protein
VSTKASRFSYPELRARVEALLRRADVRRRPGRLRVGELEVDAVARVVRLRGVPVELSQKEFALVRTLASDPTPVFTKDELLRTIWGFRTLGSNRCKARYALDGGLGMLAAAAPRLSARLHGGCRIYRRRFEVVRFAATDVSRSPSRRP